MNLLHKKSRNKTQRKGGGALFQIESWSSSSKKDKYTPENKHKLKEAILEYINLIKQHPSIKKNGYSKYWNKGKIEDWDVSKVDDMSELFENLSDFNEPIGKWKVGHVTNMRKMFFGCTSFNQPLNDWDVSHVKDMEMMFAGCTEFNQPLGNWEVNKVGDMKRMFAYCENFNQELDDWNVKHVISMDEMFIGCSKFHQPSLIQSWGLASRADVLMNMFDDTAMYEGGKRKKRGRKHKKTVKKR